MTRSRRTFLGLAALAAALPLLGSHGALAIEPIKVGEINSYTGAPAFTEPYKKGWQLALEEINAAGGINGAMIEVISRDDGGKPADAIRVAEELVSSDGVAMIWGGFYSHVGLALTDFAKQKKILYLATEPLSDAIVWSSGNKYTYRLRPSTHMQAAMLAEEAAKLDAVKWATIAPNYSYGTDAIAAFKSELKKLKPEVEFVGDDQLPPLGKIDAGSTVRAIEASKPDAIFNVTFAADLAKFVREGQIRGLFDGRQVVSMLSGEPEYLDPLGAEAPEGWIVTGYPWYAIETPEHDAFLAAYKAKFNETPMTGSLVGYNGMLTIAAALTKAGSTDTEALTAAMSGLEVSSPSGPFRFRASDHQATMGAWVGTIAVEDGKGVMTGWRYAEGEKYLPSDEEALAMRPAE